MRASLTNIEQARLGTPSQQSLSNESVANRAMNSMRSAWEGVGLFQRNLGILGVASLLVGGYAYGQGRLPSQHASGLSSVSVAMGGPNSSPKINAAFDMSRGLKKGLTTDQYESIANLIDNPDAVFQSTGYAPVWTEDGPHSGLPKNCTVAPRQVRLFDSGFRSELQNNGKVLSTAELLKLRDYLCLSVANDPRSQIRFPEKMAAYVKRLDQVRLDVLGELGVDKPSELLTEVTIADTAWAATKGCRTYGEEMTNKYFKGLSRWPTADEVTKENLPMSCMMGGVQVDYLIRALSKMHSLEMVTHTTSGRIYIDKPEGHTITGVRFKFGGNYADSFYDGTPDPGMFKKGTVTFALAGCGGPGQGGPMDQLALENLSNAYCLRVLQDSPNSMGLNTRSPDGFYVLGENRPKFSLGNFVPYKTNLYGEEGAKEFEDPSKGWRPFDAFRSKNLAKISKLATRTREEIEARIQSN